MIEINGKVYRNIQEQVQENIDDIEALDTRVTALENEPTIDAYTKTEADNKFQTIAGMSTYATKAEVPTKLSDLTNDGFVTTDSSQYITANKIFKTTVGASTGVTILPTSGSLYTEKDLTSTSYAPQRIALSKAQAGTQFNFQIVSSQGEGHNGVYTFDNSVTGTVTTKEYVDNIVGNIETLLAAI